MSHAGLPRRPDSSVAAAASRGGSIVLDPWSADLTDVPAIRAASASRYVTRVKKQGPGLDNEHR